MSIARAAFLTLTGRAARRRAAAEATIRGSRLFDAAWYAETVRYAGADPVGHFTGRVFRSRAWPNPLFDTAFYFSEQPALRGLRINPLHHYIEHGEAEGRRPNELFDPVWYAQEHGLDGARGALEHYLTQGAQRGLSPTADFDPAEFCRLHPELHLVPADAFAHAVRIAARERTAPFKGAAGLWRRIRRARRTAESAFDGLSYGAQPGEPPRYRFEPRAQAYCYLPPRRPADLDARLARLSARPVFSIVTPVYNIDRVFLEAAIASVTAQWYPHWQLVLVDDASTKPETRAALEAVDDPRIEVRFSPVNRGIAPTTNAALEAATGDYVVFLDNDDTLTPDCLYELALAIDRTGADYLYSDEDKIDAEGRFSQPFFKPDWSPDALMSIMYTCHVTAMRRSLVAEVGGLRLGYEGAQDYDLALRVSERANRVVHVPKVLYHWRTLPASLASTMAAKPYAHESVRRLKEDALLRRGVPGSVEAVASMPGQFRVNYAPAGDPLVSIVIPSRNNHAVLNACVESILTRSSYRHIEIAILDNGSDAPATLKALDALSARDKVSVIRDPRPFNYSAINNLGAAQTSGEVLLFLNDDTEVVSPDWLERMVGYAQRPHIGAVGARLHFPDGTIQHCGVVNLLDGPGHAFYRKGGDSVADFGRNVLEYDWLAVTGACLALERGKFERVGGFDEELPIAYNDVDLCVRLHEAGLFNVVCQAARLIHHESVSRGSDDKDREKQARLLRDRRRFFARHPAHLGGDPFHNPNLHPNSGLFLANPV